MARRRKRLTTLPTTGLIGARYRLTGFVTEENHATVYLADDEDVGRKVRLKILHEPDKVVGGQTARARFLAEANVSTKVKHRGLLPLFDFGDCQDTGLVFMAFLAGDGVTLDQRLRQFGPVSPDRAAFLLSELLSALAICHDNGVVHKDIRPENILVFHPNTAQERVQLTGFGSLRSLEFASRQTGEGLWYSHPAYAPPEYLLNGELTPASDLYQVGLTFVEMITGNRVVDDTNPAAAIAMHVDGELPIPPAAQASALAPVLERMLAREPARRFQDARRARSELKKVGVVAATVPPSSPHRSAPEPPETTSSRKLLLAVLAAAGLLLAGAALFVLSAPAAEQPAHPAATQPPTTTPMPPALPAEEKSSGDVEPEMKSVFLPAPDNKGPGAKASKAKATTTPGKSSNNEGTSEEPQSEPVPKKKSRYGLMP